MAYGFCKQSSENKAEFGHGAPAGIIAPEAAAHGAGTSATLPMITLGIPGSPTMAVIMGGLMIFGLQPGPMLFKEHPDFVWGLIASCWVGNFIGLILVLAFAPIFAAVLKIKFSIFMPIIVYVCAIGAYARKMNFLITGGAGSVGQDITASLLKKGYKVPFPCAHGS